MFNLSAVQTAIASLGFDGWLLYDFRGLNVLARRVIGLGDEAIVAQPRFITHFGAQSRPLLGVSDGDRDPIVLSETGEAAMRRDGGRLNGR